MIIKKVNIYSFGKLKSFELDFTPKINIIYGENERGKSTIQNFIKAMLYGLPSKKEKGSNYSLREKYTGINGEGISGELIVEKDGIEYVIKRTFGKTKKDDTVVILNGLTGEEIKDIDKDEPGKTLLGVNSSTFTKTLFISQLGVEISKDKEEEIMDKITNIFHSGENEVSIEKALNTLNANIKQLTTVRKVGLLDGLLERREELLKERFEGIQLSERTIEKEERLSNCLEEKQSLKKEIENLGLYKKYLKKVKLQKEYKEILEYLKKSEELKNQKNEILKGFKNGDNIIKEEFLNELSEENNAYLNLLDIKNKGLKDIEEGENEVAEITEAMKEWAFFNLKKEGFLEEILRLKLSQESLKEKINVAKELELQIKKEEEFIRSKRNSIDRYEILEENSERVLRELSIYDEKLRALQEKSENSKKYRGIEKKASKIKLVRNLSILGVVLGGGLILASSVFLKNNIIMAVGGVGLLLSIVAFLTNSKGEREVSSLLLEYEELKKLKKSIEDIEAELMAFGKTISAKGYEDVIYRIKTFEVYKNKESKALAIIENRKLELAKWDVKSGEEEYLKNNRIIEEALRETKSATIDEVIEKYKEYSNYKDKLTLLEREQRNRKKNLDRVSYELDLKENNIKKKLEELDLSHIDILDVSYHLKELRSKLKKKTEILNSLSSVEQTYSALMKDRNIEEIKEELKDVFQMNNNISYQNEEEIEIEEQKKSKELIEREKEIRDLKNFISNRYLGKRRLEEIEEDLRDVNSQIVKQEVKLEALKIARENMEEASLDIRKNIGPILNKSIAKYMKNLSSDGVEEILLGEDYSMKVRKDGALFPGEFLSNGAKDQLYLALRLAFIGHLFENGDVPIIFDDAFVQYDEKRREKVLKLLDEENLNQTLIFTCQGIDKKIMDNNNIRHNYIHL